jgi:hypothetical protein
MDLADVATGFVKAGLPADAVGELVSAYSEAKRRYFLGDFRPQAVEGGRFSEAAFRLLQHASALAVTPLGRTLPSVDQLLRQLEPTPVHDSIRLHIPRTLKLIYGIRNKRDVAHLADGIDPNLQDATLVVGCLDWVVAELVRLYHGVPASEAQAIIEDLVTKEVPAVQEIAGQPVILKKLQPRDQTLLMLYRIGAVGASLEELAAALRVARKDHLRTRLARLDDDRLVLRHPNSDRYHLTANGVADVEARGLAQPA